MSSSPILSRISEVNILQWQIYSPMRLLTNHGSMISKKINTTAKQRIILMHTEYYNLTAASSKLGMMMMRSEQVISSYMRCKLSMQWI